MPSRFFAEAFAALENTQDIAYLDVEQDGSYIRPAFSEVNLQEHLGSSSELARRMERVEVLVVHGAPVSEEVLDASRDLRLVCCARGGPVNVDVEAVTLRGLPLVNTPGRNADAVADLTLCFLVMLARRLLSARRFLVDGNQIRDNWEGARFMGKDLRGHTLGLIGCGRIGQQVGRRARAFGMLVLAHDPHREVSGFEQVSTLGELLARSDFVSLHARATPGNERLIDASALAAMKPGAFLINTARESLVDMDAVHAVLESGRLAGAALDVFPPGPPGQRPYLLQHENVVLTPHIGGATDETLRQGAEMIAAEITRFAAGEPLLNVLNGVAVTA